MVKIVTNFKKQDRDFTDVNAQIRTVQSKYQRAEKENAEFKREQTHTIKLLTEDLKEMLA